MAELDFVQRLRAWSYRRQGLDRSLADPGAVLDRIVGRLQHESQRRALAAGAGSRAHAGAGACPRQAGRRGAFPQHARLDPSIAKKLAGVVFGATRADPERFVPQLRAEGLDLAAYQALKPNCLTGCDNRSTPTIKKTLGLGSAELLAVRTMARELLVLRIANSVRTDQLAYVATEAWLGQSIEAVEQKEATRQLAECYLRGFGPARVQDLAWWIPASQARVREAIAALELVEVAPDYLLPADLEDAFWSTGPVDPGESGCCQNGMPGPWGTRPTAERASPMTRICRSPIRPPRPRPTKPPATVGPSSCAAAARWPAGSHAMSERSRGYDHAVSRRTGPRAEMRPDFERIATFLGCEASRLPCCNARIYPTSQSVVAQGPVPCDRPQADNPRTNSQVGVGTGPITIVDTAEAWLWARWLVALRAIAGHRSLRYELIGGSDDFQVVQERAAPERARAARPGTRTRSRRCRPATADSGVCLPGSSASRAPGW